MGRTVRILTLCILISPTIWAENRPEPFTLSEQDFNGIKNRLEEEHIISRLMIAFRLNQEDRKLLHKLEELNPESAHLCYFRGLELYEKGEKTAAYLQLNEALKRNPEHLQSLNLLGLILSDAGRLDEAGHFFLRSVRLSPYNPTSIYNYANILYRLSDFKSALEQTDRAIAYRRNFGDAYYLRGVIMRALGDKNESLSSFETAKNNGMASAEFIRDYISIAESMNRYDLIASLSVLLDPYDDPDSLRVGAHCKMLFGDYTKAVNRYARLIKSGHSFESDRINLIRAAIRLNLKKEKIIADLDVQGEDRKTYSVLIDTMRIQEIPPAVRDQIVNPAQ